jgi:iron complex outermembrane receptor protein
MPARYRRLSFSLLSMNPRFSAASRRALTAALVASGVSLATAQLAPGSADTAADAVRLDAFQVAERGVSRANSVLNLPDIAPSSPTGANPLTVLNRLPSINFNASTNFGLRTTDGTGLRLRAFTLNLIGVAVDGIPTSSANGFQANPPTRLIDAENLSSIVVSPGTGDVSTPAYSALGGSINFYTRAPEAKPGGQFTLSTGSRDLRRAYFRADTGLLAGGVSGFVSASDARQLVNFSDSSLPQLKRRKYDAQLQYQTPTLLLNAGVSHIKVDDHDDRPVSGSLYGNWTTTASPTGDLSDRGRRWFYPTYDDGNPNGLASANYDKNRNGNTDTLYRVRAVYTPSESLRVVTIPYYQDRNSYHYGAVGYTSARSFYESAILAQPGRTDVVAPLGYPTPLLAGPNRLPAGVTSLASVDDPADNKPHAREATTPGHRQGLPVSFEWKLGNQTFAAGAWYEKEQSTSTRYLRRVQNGVITNPFDYTGYISAYFERDNTIEIQQYFAKDTFKLVDDRLTIDAGVKALTVDYDFFGIPDNAFFDKGLKVHRTPRYADHFLPQVGATWALTGHDELFLNLSQNFAAPDTAVIYGTTFDQSKLQAERTDNVDFGVRTARGHLSGALSGYLIRYKNRIGDITPYDPLGFGAAYTPTAFTNVGRVEGRGVELAIAYRPSRDLSFNFAAAWQALKYKNNFDVQTGAATTTTYRIKDNTVPNTPKVIFNGDVSYYLGAFFVGANFRYQDAVFLTTSNNQKIPGYALLGAGFGYDGIRRQGALKNTRIALNIENVADRYWYYTSGASTAYSNGSFSVGTPRAYYLTASTKF